MTEQELIQENEKLNARLQKAASVFAEQKATIKRLTEERDAAVAKTGEAEKQDELFFEQQNEIESLKSQVVELTDQNKTQETSIEDLKDRLQTAQAVFKTQKATIQELEDNNTRLTTDLTKANETIDGLNQTLQSIRELVNQPES